MSRAEPIELLALDRLVLIGGERLIARDSPVSIRVECCWVTLTGVVAHLACRFIKPPIPRADAYLGEIAVAVITCHLVHRSTLAFCDSSRMAKIAGTKRRLRIVQRRSGLQVHH